MKQTPTPANPPTTCSLPYTSIKLSIHFNVSDSKFKKKMLFPFHLSYK